MIHSSLDHEEQKCPELRDYGLKHLMNDLYKNEDWLSLFRLLDMEQYRQLKSFYDPSLQGFALDLGVGCRAAGRKEWTYEEGLNYLPALWRYTLFRASLASQVDYYTVKTFRFLLLLRPKQEVIDLVKLLTSRTHKIHVLCEIVRQLSRREEEQQTCTKLLDQACDIAATLDDEHEQSRYFLNRHRDYDSKAQTEALLELGGLLGRVQRWQEARWVIDRIKIRSEQVKALANLGLDLLEAGKDSYAQKIWEEAEATIQTIRDDPRGAEQAEALEALGSTLAEAQEWEKARAVIENIDPARSEHVSALRTLGSALARAQEWEQAYALSKTIDNDYERSRVLCTLVGVLLEAQQQETLQIVLNDFDEVVSMITISWYKVKVLSSLGHILARAQDWDRASVVWEQARQTINTIEKTDHEWKVTLECLGESFAIAQQWDRAYNAISEMNNTYWQALSLIELSRKMVQAQLIERAQEIWQDAEMLADGVEKISWRMNSLSELGIVVAEAQQFERAEAIWQKLRAISGMYEDDGVYANVLKDLGRVLAETQQFELARQIWQVALTAIGRLEDQDGENASSDRKKAVMEQEEVLVEVQEQALELIHTIKNAGERAQALGYLSNRLVEVQQWEEARAVIEMMGSWFGSQERAKALQYLAIGLIEAQEWKQARETINEIDLEEGCDERGYALGYLAEALAKAEQWEQARTVIEMLNCEEEHYWYHKKQYWRSLALVCLYIALDETNQSAPAQAAWQEVVIAISLIKEPEVIREARKSLATILINAQQWQRAQEIISTLEYDYSQFPPMYAMALVQLAGKLEQASEFDQADMIWQKVATVVQMIEDDSPGWPWSQEPLLELAVDLATKRQWQLSRRIADQLSSESQLEDQVLALITLGNAQFQDQLFDQAQSTWQRAKEVASILGSPSAKARSFSLIGQAFVNNQQWDQAQELIKMIEEPDVTSRSRAGIRKTLATKQAEAQLWEQARKTIDVIEDSEYQAEALNILIQEMAQAGEYEHILRILQDYWQRPATRQDTLRLLPLVFPLILRHPEIGNAFSQPFFSELL